MEVLKTLNYVTVPSHGNYGPSRSIISGQFHPNYTPWELLIDTRKELPSHMFQGQIFELIPDLG